MNPSRLRQNSVIISRWRDPILLLALGLLLIAPLPVSAHGYIVRAIPEDRAVLERAPVRVQYWFSESLEPEFSTITIRDAERSVIAQGSVDPTNLTLLTVRLPSDLPDGAYLSELKIAFASDGHVVYDTRSFFVGVSADSGFGGGTRSDLPILLEVVWRAVVLSSQVLLFGLFAAYALVFVPAWGNPDHAAGLLPPRVMRRLYLLAWIALGAAFVGNILALLQQTMVFFNTDLSRILSDNLWSVVRTGTRFGDTWNVRMGLLLLVATMLGASLYFRKDNPSTVRAFWTANGWAMALVMGTITLGSHAAGSLMLGWIAVFSDWLHSMGAGIWAGGAAALALILPTAVHTLHGDQRRAAVLAALHRFTRIAAVGLVIVIATGIYNALNWITEPDDLPTTYGGALAIKGALVVLLIGVGAAHHIALRPERYARYQAVIKRVQNFIPSLRLEALLVFAVLIAVSILSATPVPPLSVIGQSTPPPSAAQSLGDVTVTTTITPGGPGANTYDVVLMRGGHPVEDATVMLRMSSPSRDVRGAVHPLEYVGDGLYATVGAEIDRAGMWWTTLRVDDQQIAYAWEIDARAAVLQARDLGLLNLLALLGVIGALGFAVDPLLRRWFHTLDLSPAAVIIALGSLILTVILVAAVVIIVNQTSAEYASAVSPPPDIVNTILPTGGSVASGRDLAAACGWADAQDFRVLVERMAHMRDEDLYGYTRDGWRNLPPCADTLNDTDRWNIVNYLRSLEMDE